MRPLEELKSGPSSQAGINVTIPFEILELALGALRAAQTSLEDVLIHGAGERQRRNINGNDLPKIKRAIERLDPQRPSQTALVQPEINVELKDVKFTFVDLPCTFRQGCDIGLASEDYVEWTGPDITGGDFYLKIVDASIDCDTTIGVPRRRAEEILTLLEGGVAVGCVDLDQNVRVRRWLDNTLTFHAAMPGTLARGLVEWRGLGPFTEWLRRALKR